MLAGRFELRTTAVIVVDDKPARRRTMVKWLRAAGIAAFDPTADFRTKPVMTVIWDLQPRVVVCRPGSTGVALFHPLRNMREPPMVILLRDGASTRDEVHYVDGLIVASIGTPVPMAALCEFVRSALSINARLDRPDAAMGGSILSPVVQQFPDQVSRSVRSMVQALR